MDCIHSTPVPLSFWLGLASGGPQQEVGEEAEREGRVFIPPMPPCESAWVPPPGAWGGCSPCPSPGLLLCPWGPSATAHVSKPSSILKSSRVSVFSLRTLMGTDLLANATCQWCTCLVPTPDMLSSGVRSLL